MESILLNGRYSVSDAEQLLAKLFEARTEYQIDKIEKSVLTEEDIEHSERRVKELISQKQGISRYLHTHEGKYVTLVANLSIEYAEEPVCR